MNRQQMLEKVENLSAYEVKDHRFIEEMNSEGIVLEHRKSGARLFLMSNDDDNKVFSIGFRTPPADSTGLPHILEHSVLEGSEKFPVKDYGRESLSDYFHQRFRLSRVSISHVRP